MTLRRHAYEGLARHARVHPITSGVSRAFGNGAVACVPSLGLMVKCVCEYLYVCMWVIACWLPGCLLTLLVVPATLLQAAFALPAVVTVAVHASKYCTSPAPAADVAPRCCRAASAFAACLASRSSLPDRTLHVAALFPVTSVV